MIETWSRRALLSLVALAVSCAPVSSELLATSDRGPALALVLPQGGATFVADGDDYILRRPEGWSARVSSRGAALTLPDGGEPVELGLVAWGRNGRMTDAALTAPRAGRCRDGHRRDPLGRCLRSVELRRPGLVEWYDNRSAGLEFGFDLPTSPGGSGPLRFELGLLGVDAPEGAAGGDELLLIRSGRGRLRVHGMVARDAAGRLLPSWMSWHLGTLTLVVDDRGAAYPVEVDPYLSPLVFWQASGGQGAAACGLSVALAGDVDGDGYDDLLVGLPGYEDGETSEGVALVYLGGIIGPGSVPDWMVGGDQSYAFLGAAVAGAGDVDGDGYDDVLVGAPGWDGGQPEQGLARLYPGGPLGPAVTPSWERAGDWAGGHFGAAVAGAGDLDGDGFADVAVGAPEASAPVAGSGAAMVFHGSEAGLSNGDDEWTVGGLLEAGIGAALAGGGDVNGDGFDDLLVGSPRLSSPEAEEGAAWLFYGSPSGLPIGPAWSFQPDMDDAGAGSALSLSGDFDGDGFSDLVVGAPGTSIPLPGQGAAWGFDGSASGPAATPDWAAAPTEDGALFGTSLAAVGDLDGDGYDDLAVGGPAGARDEVDLGRVVVFAGGAAGLSTSPVVVRDGSTPGGWFGVAVAPAGDQDSDGLADVLVGEPFADPTVDGQVQVLLGLPAWLDQDGDGYCVGSNCPSGLDPGDCDDLDPDRHPGATEVCNGLDDDCDGALIPAELDVDGDGFLACAGDCDDQDPTAHPGHAELCDGADNDCDGVVDDGAEELLWWPDDDGDGWGDPTFDPVLACPPLPGWVERGGDCDDGDPEVSPDAEEALCNGVDDDCDVDSPDALDLDGDGDVSCACGSDYMSDCGDCDDADRLVGRGMAETCGDGIDQDCDGEDLPCDGINPCADPSNVCRDYDCACAGAGPASPGFLVLVLLPLLRRRRGVR